MGPTRDGRRHSTRSGHLADKRGRYTNATAFDLRGVTGLTYLLPRNIGGDTDGGLMSPTAGRRHAPPDNEVRLWVSVLGETVVEIADGVADRLWLSQRPGRLLRYLVSQRGRFVPGDEIAEALWPEASAGADEKVRYLVHLLRRRLEPHRPRRGHSLSVQCLAGAYALGPSVWIDVQTFEELVDGGLRAFQCGDDDLALDLLSRALALYRGDFLSDEPYVDWAMIERERVREIAEDALRAAVEICEQRRKLGMALDYARWLAGMARYDSDVQLRLISLCVRCGRRSEAARRYGAFRTVLLREFGEEPEFDLAAASAASVSSGQAVHGVAMLRRPRLA
jgi:two-component SAPR family response regulator